MRDLQALNASDEQLLHLAGPGPVVSVAPEDIYCSRCRSTETCDDNDILLCDNAGCHRAYHQQCQSPAMETSKIPDGDELWYCEVCLAIFNCLKVINSAFATTYETVDQVGGHSHRLSDCSGWPRLTGCAVLMDAVCCQVFPELSAEEKEQAAGGNSVSAPIDVGDDDDEQNDEDFVVDGDEEADDDEDDDVEEEEVVPGREGGGGLIEQEPVPSVSEHVSDDELQYLSKDDVIDSDR